MENFKKFDLNEKTETTASDSTEDGTNVIKIMNEMSDAIGALNGMDKLVILRFQAKQIEDTFRLVAGFMDSSKKETSMDRDVMQSWQMIKNVLKGRIDQHVPRI